MINMIALRHLIIRLNKLRTPKENKILIMHGREPAYIDRYDRRINFRLFVYTNLVCIYIMLYFLIFLFQKKKKKGLICLRILFIVFLGEKKNYENVMYS